MTLFSRIFSAETIRENLIPHDILRPVRHLHNVRPVHPRIDKTLDHPVRWKALCRFHKSILIQADALPAAGDLKMVLDSAVHRCEDGTIYISVRQFPLQFHRHPLALPVLLIFGNPGGIRVARPEDHLVHIFSCLNTYF